MFNMKGSFTAPLAIADLEVAHKQSTVSCRHRKMDQLQLCEVQTPLEVLLNVFYKEKSGIYYRLVVEVVPVSQSLLVGIIRSPKSLSRSVSAY